MQLAQLMGKLPGQGAFLTGVVRGISVKGRGSPGWASGALSGSKISRQHMEFQGLQYSF